MSEVRLSNYRDNRLAIVAEQNRFTPLRPCVRVITDEYGNDVTPYDLNLMDLLSVTVVESEIEISQSKQMIAYLDSQMNTESQT